MLGQLTSDGPGLLWPQILGLVSLATVEASQVLLLFLVDHSEDNNTFRVLSVLLPSHLLSIKQ